RSASSERTVHHHAACSRACSGAKKLSNAMSRFASSSRSLTALVGSRGAIFSAALVSIVAFSGGCKDAAKGEANATSSGGDGVKKNTKEDGPAKATKPSERPKYTPYRGLLAESARAE